MVLLVHLCAHHKTALIVVLPDSLRPPPLSFWMAASLLQAKFGTSWGRYSTLEEKRSLPDMVEPPVSSAARGAFILHPSSGSSIAAKRMPFIPVRTGSALPASGQTQVRYFTGIVYTYLPNTFFRNSNVVDFQLSPKGPAPRPLCLRL